MRRLRILLATLLVAIVATGCIRSDLTVAVNDDGSGTYSAIVAIDPKAFADIAKMTGDTSDMGDDPCKEMRDSANENKADLPTGAKIENYTDGDFCGVKITAPFEAGDNPAQAIQAALGSMDSSSEGLAIGLDSFLLEKDGNGWRFEATPQSSSTDSGSSDLGDMSMFESFLQGASSIVRIKLPGRVVEQDSNPDAIDGNGTMIWSLNLMGETRVLKARTEPGDVIKNKTYTDAGKNLPNVKGAGTVGAQSSGSSDDGGGSSALPWIIGGVVVVAAIAGFLLWRKSKGKGKGTGTPAPSGPGAASMPPSGLPTSPPVTDPAAQWGAPATPAGEPTAAWGAPTAAVPSQPVAAQPPAAQPAAAAPGAGASPSEPQWDAARNTYIVWDAASSKWLQYDNAAGAWKPIE